MVSNHAIGNSQTELKLQSKSLQRNDSALENELENRIKNLDKLVDSIHVALDQESFSGKPHALDLLNDLRVKIKASHNIFRVARLLREPARESMFLKVSDSLKDLEEVVASHLGVEMT
jgi:hypothetical protein